MIYWGVDAPRLHVPQNVHAHSDPAASEWKGKSGFSEDADGIVASTHYPAADNEQLAALPGVIIGNNKGMQNSVFICSHMQYYIVPELISSRRSRVKMPGILLL
jgi:hypothetical protein